MKLAVRSSSVLALGVVAAFALACGPATPAPSPVEAAKTKALLDVKAEIDAQLAGLATSVDALCAAAPAPDADGWDATHDAAAVTSMKTAWREARKAYEHVEGAIAMLFPELDVTTDQRYDAFLEANGPDTNLFDDENVTGIHAIERILWADSIPAPVVTFEAGLTGYQAAKFPASLAEARGFKEKLCGRLVTDIAKMRSQFAPLALDPAAAYFGVIGSMHEQVEKAEKAATGEEESRYAQYTLADMRANVDAGRRTYDFFLPWINAVGTTADDAEIVAGFARLDAAYAGIAGDSLPAVPHDWSSAHPTEQDLATPFGKLYSAIASEADGTLPTSLVTAMNASAKKLGIAEAP